MDTYRTPDAQFRDLPDFPYAPHYAEVGTGADALRMAWVESGPADGEPVVLLHGEPTWSFLYRKVMPVLADAGIRAIAPDLVGFGRSDKPTALTDYSYARHVEWTRALLFDAMALTNVTFVGQDWGGLIGLRLAAEHPDRFAGFVASNTALPTGHHPMPKEWLRFRDFVVGTEDLPIGWLVTKGCLTELTEAEIAAYDAPFPEPAAKLGPRAFPTLVPASPDDPAVSDQARAWKLLSTFDKPFLCAFTDSDPIMRGADAPMREIIPGAKGQPHTTIEGAAHFVQEDAGVRLGEIVRDFVVSHRAG